MTRRAVGRSRWAGFLVALLVSAGCGKEPTAGATPGVLDVVLLGPAEHTGAILFDIEGGAVDSVVATGHFTRSARFTGVAQRVLVAGDSLGGVIARVYVPDLGAGHRATVVEAADGRDYQLLPTDRFVLPLLPRPY